MVERLGALTCVGHYGMDGIYVVLAKVQFISKAIVDFSQLVENLFQCVVH